MSGGIQQFGRWLPRLLLAMILLAAAASTPAQPDAGEEAGIEEVIVTGSRIARPERSATGLTTIIGRREIDLSGAAVIEDLLNVLPQIAPDFDRSSNNPGEGLARINLRGLGVNRSLVMLNGRRFAPSGVDGAVDLNNIPAGLIERIEVVTGGASAVYGSDAVAGVVNFILGSDLEGIEADARFEITEAGDGEVYDADILLGRGLADGRGHAALYFNYHRRQSIAGSARKFTRTTLSEDILAGTLSPGGSNFTPAGHFLSSATIGGVPAPDGITFRPDGTPRAFVRPDDLFNFAPFTYIQTPLERWSLGAFADYRPAPSLRAFLEASYTSNSSEKRVAPVPAFDVIVVNTDNPLLAPETRAVLIENFDADGDGLATGFFGRRLIELGPRFLQFDRAFWRVVGGLEGHLAAGWSWEVSYSHSRLDGADRRLNGASRSRLLQGLLVDPASGGCLDPSGGCVPVDPFGEGNLDPAAADFIRLVPFRGTNFVEEQIASAAAVGELATLPAGGIDAALGLEWRRLQSAFSPDERLFSRDSLGFGIGQPVAGRFTVKEAFGEILVPLLAGRPLIDHLGLEAGARISDYSTSGTVATWKAGGVWSPAEGVRFRAMYQRAVRAPNIQELFEGARIGTAPLLANFDLCSASKDPVANGLADLCIAQGLAPGDIGAFEAVLFFPAETVGGGNPDLDNETANSVTAGLTLRPRRIADLEVTLDYYSIRISRAIAELPSSQIVAVCFFERDPASEFCRAIERGPSGDIVRVRTGQRNVARLKAEGIDLQIAYRRDLPRAALFAGGASLALRFLGSYAISKGAQITPAAAFQDCAGRFGFPCNVSSFGVLPELKTTTRLTYDSGPLTASLRWRRIGSVKSALARFGAAQIGLDPSDVTLAVPRVGSQNYFDLTFDYRLSDRLKFYAGVINLFENGPPVLGAASTQSNTDPSTYDIFGRRFFIGLTATVPWP